jgi:hypothetical protein
MRDLFIGVNAKKRTITSGEKWRKRDQVNGE